MAAPNIVNVTSITGKTAVQAVGTTATAIVSNAAASNTVVKVNALYISNVDGVSATDITVDLFRSATAYRLAYTVAVPPDAVLDVITKPIYLEEGDSLRLTAGITLDLEAVCSYEIIA